MLRSPKLPFFLRLANKKLYLFPSLIFVRWSKCPFRPRFSDPKFISVPFSNVATHLTSFQIPAPCLTSLTNARPQVSAVVELNCSILRVITRRKMVGNRRFGTTRRSHIRLSICPKRTFEDGIDMQSRNVCFEPPHAA
jgi:hypothetical protein